MDVREAGVPTRSEVRRCHLWCWTAQQSEWEQRTVVTGGLSFVGLVTAAGTALMSARGNRRRRAAAIAGEAPRWRYVSSGTGQVIDGHLVITETSGIVRSFDLRGAVNLDSPASGWLWFQQPGSSAPWAIQVMES